MFKEVLKIIPKIDNADLNDMDRKLSKRFGKIAKKFGKGLGAALAGGGLAGIALGLIDKLLNPLKETQEAIDRVLKQGDDIVTNAKQFGTTAGKLFKLQALAKSTGLDEAGLFMLINKFQTKVAEAEADPSKQTSVRQFVGQKDSAEAFFGFIQALQKMDKNSQLLVQQEVFGEKQVLKMADFLQTNMKDQLGLIGARPSTHYDMGLEKVAGLNDWQDIFGAKRMLEDSVQKAKIINEGMIAQRAQQLQIELDRENQRIGSYESLMKISETSSRMMFMLEKGMVELTKLVSSMSVLTDMIKKFQTGRGWRGLFGEGK